MRVIGTAGHVDHGKSTLVRALTGIDPDRLQEEKEREMTIDLGFAWLTLPSGLEVSVVDVPGHEDFIKNMLAGVGGIDLALLVIAADEGFMPQTREHLAILDLLQVRDGVVALTKSDLVDDPEWLDMVEEEVTQELAGSVLEKARVIPVSARTGQGLDDLVQELDRLLQAPSPRRDVGRPRLPIDRVFSVLGFGTVVTGTLIDGPLRSGEEVEILPKGWRARIRGLQTHKQKVEAASPSIRLAVNLTGVSRDELLRGDVLTRPGWLQPTTLLDVRLELLPRSPQPLAHGAVLDFFVGAAQCEARVRILDGKRIEPGEAGWVQLALSQPVAAVKGDRFIVRSPSPSMTLGGGAIVDPNPQRRHRRQRTEVLQRLEALAHGSADEVLLQELEREQIAELGSLLKTSSLGAVLASETLLMLIGDGRAVVLDPAVSLQIEDVAKSAGYVLTATQWDALLRRMQSALRDYHQRYPLRSGMPREELKSRMGLAPRAFAQLAAMAAAQGNVLDTEAVVSLAQHRVAFSSEQQRHIKQLLDAFAKSPYAPPSISESEAVVGVDVLAALIEQGELVRVSETIAFSADAYQTMCEMVLRHLREHQRITLAEVRDMFGTSRKYAQALLEHLDERRVTRRVGDERVLR